MVNRIHKRMFLRIVSWEKELWYECKCLIFERPFLKTKKEIMKTNFLALSLFLSFFLSFFFPPFFFFIFQLSSPSLIFPIFHFCFTFCLNMLLHTRLFNIVRLFSHVLSVPLKVPPWRGWGILLWLSFADCCEEQIFKYGVPSDSFRFGRL